MKEINCNGELINFDYPKIMGILNVTPDSFYDGGKYTSKEHIIKRLKIIVDEGADIIDIGAYSSRPGADEVPEKEEIERLISVLEIARELYPQVCISVDTFRANVAKFVVENYAVNIINDIYAGFGSENMLETIAKLNVPYIMMHMQGNPATMQKNPKYNDIVFDIMKFFSERIKKANLIGISDIIIDPGFGFGKTIDHNYELMNRLEEFSIFDEPLLVGISRKSMIYKYLNFTADQALPGTIALNTISIMKGASILRVHDVAETKQIVAIVEKMKNI